MKLQPSKSARHSPSTERNEEKRPSCVVDTDSPGGIGDSRGRVEGLEGEGGDTVTHESARASVLTGDGRGLIRTKRREEEAGGRNGNTQ